MVEQCSEPTIITAIINFNSQADTVPIIYYTIVISILLLDLNLHTKRHFNSVQFVEKADTISFGCMGQ